MKWIVYFFIFISLGCGNTGSVNESGNLPVEIDTTKALQTELPNTDKQRVKTLSQKEVIINESLVMASDFYNNLKNQNYIAANKDMHPDALTETTINEWIDIYKKAQNKSGPLGFVTMIDKGANCQILAGNGKGDYSELIFDAQYRDGNLREKLIFFRKDSTETLQILGYQYNQIADRVVLSEILRIK